MDDNVPETKTTTGTDTPWEYFGFEGGLIFAVIGGLFASLALFGFLASRPETFGLTRTTFIISTLPFVGTWAAVQLFFNHKPPYYFTDLIETWFFGSHFEFRADNPMHFLIPNVSQIEGEDLDENEFGP